MGEGGIQCYYESAIFPPSKNNNLTGQKKMQVIVISDIFFKGTGGLN